ncbi:MAG: iron ABC transporter permease [Oscillospiraceae bacterium]|nr:iron ABC transporter permease [Oscillospiraceae bacterium]
MRFRLTLALLTAALLLLIVLNVTIGSVALSFGEILHSDIFWKIRFPRLLAAAVLGGALALSGYLLQTFFNNPIAGPSVLGISSGAKLTVALLMVGSLVKGFAVTSAAMIGAAFAGAMLATGFVLLIARKMAKSSFLIVSGVMVGYICSAVTDFVITFADDASIVNLHNWSRGSFSGTNWADIRVMTVAVAIVSTAAFALSKTIGAYLLGDNYAKSVGVNIKAFRIALVALSSALCACVTAYAGPIGFVGIAVPHLICALLKSTKPIAVIPLCFLGGAVFCLGCDLIARTLFAPTEMSISSVSSVFGAPVVIYVMSKRGRRRD